MTLVVERGKISDLRPHPANARQGNVAVIMDSLRTLGQFRPIVVNRGSHTGRPMEILAGHHLVLAATELGWESVDFTTVDVDDETGKRILLADNRTSDLATYDERMLAELLASLANLDGTGYTAEDLEALEKLLLDYTPPDEDQEILDKSDEAMWPEVRARIHPDLHARWMEIPGGDDAERIDAILSDIE